MSDKDIVYRQDAIDAIRTWGLIDGLSEGQAIEILADEKKLPSAQLERKRGKWNQDEEIPNTCSVCGEDWDKYVEGQEIWYTGEIPNFCPNCGADMREGDLE